MTTLSKEGFDAEYTEAVTWARANSEKLAASDNPRAKAIFTAHWLVLIRNSVAAKGSFIEAVQAYRKEEQS